jgi:hypothetical protein
MDKTFLFWSAGISRRSYLSRNASDASDAKIRPSKIQKIACYVLWPFWGCWGRAPHLFIRLNFYKKYGWITEVVRAKRVKWTFYYLKRSERSEWRERHCKDPAFKNTKNCVLHVMTVLRLLRPCGAAPRLFIRPNFYKKYGWITELVRAKRVTRTKLQRSGLQKYKKLRVEAARRRACFLGWISTRI